VRKNSSLNSVRSLCGDETSKVKEDGGKKAGHKKRPSVFIFLIFFGNNLPITSEMVRLAMICVQIEDRRGLMPKLCSSWNLPPKAGANYVSPGLVNEGSGLQSDELFLHDLIHLSLIGRVLEV